MSVIVVVGKQNNSEKDQQRASRDTWSGLHDGVQMDDV
jgi:hypothetical protein